MCQIAFLGCMLHNIALRRNIPLQPVDKNKDVQGDVEGLQNVNDSGEEEGNDLKQDVIDNFFSRGYFLLYIHKYFNVLVDLLFNCSK